MISRTFNFWLANTFSWIFSIVSVEATRTFGVSNVSATTTEFSKLLFPYWNWWFRVSLLFIQPILELIEDCFCKQIMLIHWVDCFQRQFNTNWKTQLPHDWRVDNSRMFVEGNSVVSQFKRREIQKDTESLTHRGINSKNSLRYWCGKAIAHARND